eukprot:SM000016S01940  [mRNA]  locus=s16:720786:725951:- [translate_table: standard]
MAPRGAAKRKAASPASVLPAHEEQSSDESAGAALVTAEMTEEERRLEEERARDEEAETAAATARGGSAEAAAEGATFDKLEALLSKTQLYSQFLSERMDDIRLAVDADEPAAEEETVATAEGKSGSGGGAGGKTAGQQPARKSRRLGPSSTSGVEGTESARATAREEDALMGEQRALAPSLTGGALKAYQLKGIKWLISLWQNGLNGILADQMGLGKTVQTIGLLAHLRGKGMHGPFLVVAPLSTLSNWISEICRWAPTLPVLLYHGTKEERAEKRANRMPRHVTAKFPVIVTSYEIAMNDRKFLQNYHWKYIVVDEGHRLKNFDCRLIRELRRMTAENTLLLTGTPLQNNLAELWSLLNFLLPDIFKSLEDFTSWFDFAGRRKDDEDQGAADRERRDKVVGKLHGILKPFLLRRLKEDVEKSLPKKKEIILYAKMTRQQQEFNEHLVNRTLEDYMQMEKNNPGSQRAMKLNNVLMQLRKNCNHPDLLASQFDDATDYPPVDELVSQSGKLLLLDRLLKRLKQRGHKVLIFSQMTRMLDILEYYLEQHGHQPCRIDGSIAQSTRQEEIKAFNEDPNVFIFLLSTRAGGLGINLVSADTVIIYDSDWNPHQDMQAMDRCHRIGQTRPVHVYRLAMAHSVECKMLQVASDKLKLEHLVIAKGQFKQEADSTKSGLEEAELVALLRPEQKDEDIEVQSTTIGDDNLELLLDRSDLEEGHPDMAKCKSLPWKGPGWQVVMQGGSTSSVLSSIND